jgi:ferredoxin
MKKNIIFYFSGTGNCLKTAETISENISNTEIIPMASNNIYEFNGDYESIGFVYPVYFAGLPAKAADYISKLTFPKNKDIYYYTINTCGSIVGNSMVQLKELLAQKGVDLDYSAKLKMFSNYVVMYNMKENIKEITEKSDKDLIPIIENIKKKYKNKTGRKNPIIEWWYHKKMKSVPAKDKYYNVSDDCISCKICVNVCPVENIKLEGKKPEFLNHCEQCTACIQYCPKKAINFKNKTQNRRRYTNPDVNWKKLSEKNKSY